MRGKTSLRSAQGRLFDSPGRRRPGLLAMTIIGMAVVFATVALAQNLGYVSDPNWKAPPEAAARMNPLPADAVGGGRKLFARHCVECHGEDGSGRKRGAADLQLPAVQQQTDGSFFWKVSNGNPRRGMPSFSSLPEAQRWQLVMYIRTLARK